MARWATIYAENPTWFSPETMDWWKCVVYEDSLVTVGGVSFFITSECANIFDKTGRVYSVRFCEDRVETFAQQLATYDEAADVLRDRVQELRTKWATAE